MAKPSINVHVAFVYFQLFLLWAASHFFAAIGGAYSMEASMTASVYDNLGKFSTWNLLRRKCPVSLVVFTGCPVVCLCFIAL
jgi:hypothetical protein